MTCEASSSKGGLEASPSLPSFLLLHLIAHNFSIFGFEAIL